MPRQRPIRASRKVIYVALIGNLAIAITKFIAAALSGSSAMLSEGVHSLVDTGNEVVLLYGFHRASLPADRKHPLGHARELYFWTFIVALLIFSLGAGVSIYEGIAHLLDPIPLSDISVVYAVLAISFVFEAISWRLALTEFRRIKGHRGYLQAARESKDPSTFTVLFEDSAALLGLLIAFIGVSLAHWLQMPALDGAASLAIGVLLAAAAAFLARESKDLLVGEAAHPQVEASVRQIVEMQAEVEAVNGVLTTQLGPDQVIVALSAEFKDELTTVQIERCAARLEARIREQHPEVQMLFIKPQSPAAWQRRHHAAGPSVDIEMQGESTALTRQPQPRLEHALNAVLSQSRAPQNLGRLMIAAIRSAECDGVAAATRLIEADVVANRASND